MKTISRTFSKPGRNTFSVLGKFKHANGPGLIEIEGDAQAFEQEMEGRFSVPVQWNSMTGELFQSAFIREPMGWTIETTEQGDWTVLEM